MFSFHNSFLFLLKRYPAEFLQNEHFCPCYGIKSFQAAKCEWDRSRLSHALLDQHIAPGAETFPGWDAWAPGLLSPSPPTAWTGRFCHCPWPFMSFPGDLDNETLPAMQETQVRSLGGKDLLEKGMATHSSTPAWRIPRTEEPGRLHSTGLQRVGHNWATTTLILHSSLVGGPALQQLPWVSLPRWYLMHWKFPYHFSYKNYLIMNSLPEDLAFWVSRWGLNIGEE